MGPGLRRGDELRCRRDAAPERREAFGSAMDWGAAAMPGRRRAWGMSVEKAVGDLAKITGLDSGSFINHMIDYQSTG
jgi:hypothetical protein